MEPPTVAVNTLLVSLQALYSAAIFWLPLPAPLSIPELVDDVVSMMLMKSSWSWFLLSSQYWCSVMDTREPPDIKYAFQASVKEVLLLIRVFQLKSQICENCEAYFSVLDSQLPLESVSYVTVNKSSSLSPAWLVPLILLSPCNTKILPSAHALFNTMSCEYLAPQASMEVLLILLVYWVVSFTSPTLTVIVVVSVALCSSVAVIVSVYELVVS